MISLIFPTASSEYMDFPGVYGRWQPMWFFPVPKAYSPKTGKSTTHSRSLNGGSGADYDG